MTDSLHITDPAELISSIPALLGFVPHRSLVVAAVRPGSADASPTLSSVVRFNLKPTGDQREQLRAIALNVARICTADQADRVLAVVIDDRLGVPDPAEPPHHWTAQYSILASALDSSLAVHEVLLAGAWAVPATDGDQLWWSLLTRPDGGVVPDPGVSSIAMARALDGRPIYRSRADLESLLYPNLVQAEVVSVELAAAERRRQARYLRALRHNELAGYHRALLEMVLWRIADVACGEIPSPAAIAELVGALREPTVRGTLYALPYTTYAGPAEQLWLRMVQALPGAERADAAAVLGFSAYVRGDGPFAGMAFDAALAVEPSHFMAGQLETGLRTGMRPGPLRRVARSGHDVATDLGVDLGPLRRSSEVSR
ncbi:DUF4192 domain-containing protein [Nocardia sp. NPDC051832]|uniref:DUF4192 domain-containing protein n=1 Tax=Nocardia sp. NPDC051832 TaxID=3155673 RepID=UPI003417E880